MKKAPLLILFNLIFFALASQNIYTQNKPYVIMVSYDGMRWDYVNRGITPVFDRIKSEGVSALSLKPAFPSKTFPNHVSLITGMYTEKHGIIANDFRNPETGERFGLFDRKSATDPKWFLGEAFWETARKAGITTASYYWPSSEVTQKERRPDYYEIYDNNKNPGEVISGVVNWLKLPYAERPHFICCYIHETDNKGHSFGPNAPETNRAIVLQDSLTGVLLAGIEKLGMSDSINVIVLSDHGMAEISREKMINIDTILGEGHGADGEGPVMMLNPKDEDVNKIYEKLKMAENHYKVYTKNTIPSFYHYSENPFIQKIIVIADPGWSLTDTKKMAKMTDNYMKGNHGWDNSFVDMHGIFFAKGPAFKVNYQTGSLWNVDIYPLLCRIFGISPNPRTDGNLERIEFVLKETK